MSKTKDIPYFSSISTQSTQSIKKNILKERRTDTFRVEYLFNNLEKCYKYLFSADDLIVIHNFADL